MPGKYSHSLVLDNYENLGLINRAQRCLSYDAAQRPPSPASIVPPSLPSPALPGLNPPPPFDSRASTPTPASTRTFFISPTNARSSSVPSFPYEPSGRSRNPSLRNSLSSNSTASSSHQSSSIVTQIYAPRRPASQTRIEHCQPRQILAYSPQHLDLPGSSPAKSSPGTLHTRTNSSSTPRSRDTTAKTSLDVYRPISPIAKDLTEDEEPYFGSEEDAASLSSLSSSPSSPRAYSFKPWENPKLESESHSLYAPYIPPPLNVYESSSSFVSRQRGSSTDDAEPPPIARARRVQFLSPINSSKNLKYSSTSNRLSFLRSPFSISRRSVSLSHKEVGFARQSPVPNSRVPIPYATSPQLRPSQAIGETNDLNAKSEWQASEFDISSMSEADQKRLWKKGINPRLKAEMEAARKGKWMGPLVGNTFIG